MFGVNGAIIYSVTVESSEERKLSSKDMRGWRLCVILLMCQCKCNSYLFIRLT